MIILATKYNVMIPDTFWDATDESNDENIATINIAKAYRNKLNSLTDEELIDELGILVNKLDEY